VNFSSTPASFSYVNSTLLVGYVPTLPSSTAVFDVNVGGPAHSGDQFVVVPVSASLSTTNTVISAEPLFLHPTPNATTEAVVASYSSNDSIELLTSTNSFSTYATRWVAFFNVSLGSPLLSNMGSTRVQIPGGSAGEVTAVSAGPYVFLAYTSRELDENALRTITSNTSGTQWSSPYLVANGNGSIDAPQTTVSPAGYIFLTWRANGQGGWGAEQRVFSDSGRALSGVTSVPGVGGAAGTIVQSLSVAVDGWQRPLYAWSLVNSTGVSSIDYTGAYLSVRQLVSLVWQRFNQTVPSDFRTFGSSQIATFEGDVTSALGAVLSDLHSRSYSGAQTEIVADLYPYLTVNRTGYSFSAPASDPYACTSGLGNSATWLSNTSGPYSTGTSFGVYAAWLVEAAGCGAVGLPHWPGVPGGAPVPIPSGSHQSGFPPPPVLGTIVAPYSTAWGYVNITPVTVNPNAVLLSAQSTFGGNSSDLPFHVSPCYGTIDRSYYPASYSEEVENPGGAASAPAVFTSHNEVPSVYLTNLQADFNGTWTVEITVHFNESYFKSETCSGATTQSSGMETPSLGPSKITFALTGTYTTYLGALPTPPPINVDTNGATHQATLYSNFTASVIAAIHLFSVTQQGGGYYGSNSTSVGSTKENISLSGVPILGSSKELWATFELNSTSGSASKSWPQVNASQVTHFSHPLWANYSYEFQTVANPVGLFLNSTPVVNITATDAAVAWYSNMSGTGWVRYQETGSGQFQQTALRWTIGSNHTWYRYTLELHGLDPWSFYTILVGIDASPSGNPVVYEKYIAVTFQTTAAVSLSEWEAAYDSITGEGGGALIYWNWPNDFSGFAYENGTLTYWPTNDSRSTSEVVVPIPQLKQYAVGYNSGVIGVNLSALNVSWNYSVALLLNVSYHGKALVVTNEPFTFVYERDTSGDGLTNWEKVRGWNVTTQYLPGEFETVTEQANPYLYATNGLTSDFLEKEYGLDPNTISTTGDGMLDVWNLTFNLGTGSPALPASGFNYWYENNSYHFTQACPDPVLRPPCSFTPIYSNISNLSDDGPGSAKVLWSGSGTSSALAKLERLIANDSLSPLRGVTGTYKGSRTLTVWGKLSWGADPLSWSTAWSQVGSGIPGDGSLVDPLGVTDLNITLTSWGMHGLASGDGVAVFIHATSNATQYLPSGQTDYSNYSLSSTSGSIDAWSGSFPLNFQVAPNEQQAGVNFSLVAALSGGSFTELSVGSIFPDLENTSATSSRLHPPNSYAWLNLTYQVVPVFSKANTMVLVPGDNSTLSRLPIGLTRYVGQQYFVLLAVNDTVRGSNTLTLGSIPYTNSSSPGQTSTGLYRLNLSGGMNNILVPRSFFIHSPLGQELLLNRTNVSIALTNVNGLLKDYWDPASWQARVMGYNWNGSMNANGGPGYINVYSNTSQNCTTNVSQCGVVSSNLAAGQQVPAKAIESIFVMNVGSNATFTNLLAGLLLNTSGNFTGWGFSGTPYLSSLGLSNEVTSALANSYLFNSGSYKAPTYQPPPPQPSVWQKIGKTVWNAYSGTFGPYISVVWGWVQAAGSYAAYIVKELARWALSALSQTVGVLKSVAAAIVYLIDLLASVIWTVIYDMLSLVLNPFESSVAAYDSGISSAFNNSIADVSDGGSGNGRVTQSDAVALLDALSGFPLLFAASIATLAVIGLTIASDVDIGPGFVVGILLSLIAVGALAAIRGLSGSYVLSEVAISAFDSSVNVSLPANKGVHPQWNWTALGESVGIAAGVTDVPLALFILSREPAFISCNGGIYANPTCAPTWSMVAFTCAFLTLMFAGLAAGGVEGAQMSVLAVVFGFLGTAASGVALANSKTQSGTRLFSILDLSLDSIGFAAGFDNLIKYV
jgi:hypothetical protein